MFTMQLPPANFSLREQSRAHDYRFLGLSLAVLLPIPSCPHHALSRRLPSSAIGVLPHSTKKKINSERVPGALPGGLPGALTWRTSLEHSPGVPSRTPLEHPLATHCGTPRMLPRFFLDHPLDHPALADGEVRLGSLCSPLVSETEGELGN